MSERANFFKIGMFVIVGVSLICVSIIVLGAGLLFQDYQQMETYFNESVQGLAVGSPVKFRGVKIGTVDRIGFCRDYYGRFAEPGNEEHERQLRYVYVRVAMQQSVLAGDVESDIQKTLDMYASRGLRVRLASLGLTGQLYLEADYVKTEHTGMVFWKKHREHFYIPSAKSKLEQLTESVTTITQNIAQVDFATLSDDLSTLLKTLDSQLKDVDVAELQGDVIDILADVKAVTANLNKALSNPAVESIPQDLSKSLKSIAGTVKLFDSVIARVDQLLATEGLDKSVEQLPELISHLRRAASRLNLLIASQQQDVASVIENLRLFTEDLKAIGKNLEKYPSQFLFGEAPAKVKK